MQSAVWASVAVRAHDQLRQRVAWILSQIFVINEDSIGKKDMSEMYLTYYDIFVRNAFGNYRDIMREVALSPMMVSHPRLWFDLATFKVSLLILCLHSYHLHSRQPCYQVWIQGHSCLLDITLMKILQE